MMTRIRTSISSNSGYCDVSFENLLPILEKHSKYVLVINRTFRMVRIKKADAHDDEDTNTIDIDIQVV